MLMKTEIQYSIGGLFMFKNRLYLCSTIILCCLTLLSGCKETSPSLSPNNGQMEEQPTSTTKPNLEDNKPHLVDIIIQPESLVLSPESKYKISIMGTYTD